MANAAPSNRMLTTVETGSRADGNSVPSLHFAINLEHLKYKVNSLKKQTYNKAMSIFTACQLREEQDNNLSGLCRAFGFLEVDHS